MDDKKIFYVYVYLDPRKYGCFQYEKYQFDYEPFYVGKGSNERMYNHLNQLNKISRKVSKIKSILNDNLKPKIIKYKEDLTEQEAFDTEIEMINLIGRLDLKSGPLCNHTNGGEGGNGRIISEETKRKISKSHIGIRPTEETKRKISIIYLLLNVNYFYKI